MGATINSMVLGGLALVFSRLIDNSVVVLENIYRHMEMGKPPREAAEEGGREVALPVLAGTFTTALVFFPVVLSVRRQPLPLHRASAICRAGAVRLISRGAYSGSAVLRQVHQECPRGSWHIMPGAARSSALYAGSTAATTGC